MDSIIKRLNEIATALSTVPRIKHSWLDDLTGAVDYWGDCYEEGQLWRIQCEGGMAMDRRLGEQREEWMEKYVKENGESVKVKCGDLRFLLDLARECLELRAKGGAK